MWIHIDGRDQKVINPIHIKRMLADGGVEIADPTVQKQEEAPQAPEQTGEPPKSGEDNGGTEQTGEPEQPPEGDPEQSQNDDKKPKRSSKP